MKHFDIGAAILNIAGGVPPPPAKGFYFQVTAKDSGRLDNVRKNPPRCLPGLTANQNRAATFRAASNRNV